ncbi:MAG: 16S rRNA (adenine(1518)-N(6)/adenine(1519)-N(6))-dimethyltransferase RsmA [Treponema sp.]|nr:16S rRNA (adenine(1518)-N(6)/adenine(1519)-N(6))-dimethyltransferase RsmA [Treponema sp.]
MNIPDYNSPSALKSLMEENEMAMQKKFGQNFMVNPAARTGIINMLKISNGDSVWEIGPGLGCMTNEILSKGAKLTVFEIDRGFISMLHGFFHSYEKDGYFRIIEGDVLKNWFQEINSEGKDATKIKLFGNLPYNIAATFVADTITKGIVFDRCVFTVQKEVADRMRAKPSTKNYSSFSVLCQWRYELTAGIELAPGNFWPRPNVSSQAVLFIPKEKTSYSCSNPVLFVRLVHALFSQRRKTLLNNIKPILPQGVDANYVFSEAAISSSERAENLTVEDFLRLSEILNSAKL